MLAPTSALFQLQRDLTSLDVLWLPPARPALARFINSLILAEETDLDPDGAAASHFELDGDDHGPAGVPALAEAAADDERAWEAARGATTSALAARITLWDSVHAELARIDSPQPTSLPPS